MSTFKQRVAKNLLPLSLSTRLPDASKEWYFTEKTLDHEKPISDCEMCEKDKLRYHFEIKNRHTKKCLWVGSTCILRYQVSVYEDGKLLNADKSNRKLKSLIQKMRLDSCIKALRNLAAKESTDILTSGLDFYIKNKYLTPKFAFVVLWKLSSNNIDHSPTFFTVSLIRDKYKKDLAEMKKSRVHLIWPALSSGQRKLAIEYGHTAPKNK